MSAGLFEPLVIVGFLDSDTGFVDAIGAERGVVAGY